MIEGVEVLPLKRIQDERGMVMHMLKATDPYFQHFGEIYFSVIHPGVIKAWHLHSRMTINYAVVSGNIKLVLFDQRPDSKTKGQLQEIYVGQVNYNLVRVLAWNFKDEIMAQMKPFAEEGGRFVIPIPEPGVV